MENASLPDDVWNSYFTTSSSEGDNQSLYLYEFRDRVLAIIHVIIGIVGVLDNLFVIMIFALFIKIAEKVQYAYYKAILSSKVFRVYTGPPYSV